MLPDCLSLLLLLSDVSIHGGFIFTSTSECADVESAGAIKGAEFVKGAFVKLDIRIRELLHALSSLFRCRDRPS